MRLLAHNRIFIVYACPRPPRRPRPPCSDTLYYYCYYYRGFRVLTATAALSSSLRFSRRVCLYLTFLACACSCAELLHVKRTEEERWLCARSPRTLTCDKCLETPTPPQPPLILSTRLDRRPRASSAAPRTCRSRAVRQAFLPNAAADSADFRLIYQRV